MFGRPRELATDRDQAVAIGAAIFWLRVLKYVRADHDAITGIRIMILIDLVEHDFFGEPVPTFPDHAHI
jgi:hypothetical protein